MKGVVKLKLALCPRVASKILYFIYFNIFPGIFDLNFCQFSWFWNDKLTFLIIKITNHKLLTDFHETINPYGGFSINLDWIESKINYQEKTCLKCSNLTETQKHAHWSLRVRKPKYFSNWGPTLNEVAFFHSTAWQAKEWHSHVWHWAQRWQVKKNLKWKLMWKETWSAEHFTTQKGDFFEKRSFA